jgi:hypothetical protein
MSDLVERVRDVLPSVRCDLEDRACGISVFDAAATDVVSMPITVIAGLAQHPLGQVQRRDRVADGPRLARADDTVLAHRLVPCGGHQLAGQASRFSSRLVVIVASFEVDLSSCHGASDFSTRRARARRSQNSPISSRVLPFVSGSARNM